MCTFVSLLSEVLSELKLAIENRWVKFLWISKGILWFFLRVFSVISKEIAQCVKGRDLVYGCLCLYKFKDVL